VADEPVSMVDASLRAMILDIMLKLREQQIFPSFISPTT
jgi:peptide/nickel transport system ATP-binding protein